MKKLLLNILLMSSFFSWSQEKAPELPRFSIRGNIGIPKALSSTMFRHSFTGIATIDGSVNYNLFSGYIIGIGYSYTYYGCQKYFRDPLKDNIQTNLQTQNGYLTVGYNHFFSDRGFSVISANMGLNYGQYKGVRYKHDSIVGQYPTNFTTAFIEPKYSLYFIVDKNFAIGGYLSYTYSFTKFNPLQSQLNEWGPYGYNSLPNKWNMSLITLGFGFYYGLSSGK